MYVGDNDRLSWGLTVPAGTANGQFAANRFWRNAGLSSTSSNTIGSDLVGWEWDQIPSPTSPIYARFIPFEPSGVQQLSLTGIPGDAHDSWIQDYGLQRLTTPPVGQPSMVSAVEYRAKSGALVFASGTMQWAYGLDVDRAINQATYNVISDMGVQPATPEAGIVLDPKPRPHHGSTRRHH
jgi:hypothetical protein